MTLDLAQEAALSAVDAETMALALARGAGSMAGEDRERFMFSTYAGFCANFEWPERQRKSGGKEPID